MADRKLERLLDDAEKAYAQGDKRKGAHLVDEILRKDFNHAGTWQLLYRFFGKGREFGEFQRAFTLQYYPDQLYQLRKPEPAAEPAPAEKKPGFFARLFRRKKKTAVPGVPDELAASAGLTAAPTPPPAAPEPPKPVVAEPPMVRPGSSSIQIPRDNPPGAIPGVPGGGTGLLGRTGALGSTSSAPSASKIDPPPETQALPSFPSRTMTAVHRAEALSGRERIHVVVVDDIPQTRETVIRTLRFQENIEVVGTATNGLQAIQLVREVLPDVVIMDVNMPDMDGITATGYIKKEVPHSQIIILTVQDDVDYIRRAMMAGARDFLAKPPVIEELVAAVQRAADIAREEREKIPLAGDIAPESSAALLGRGKIITVYSPRGGSGVTLLASNLAAALHNPDTKVVLVDGNLQFGDVDVFFNMQAPHTIVDLAPRIEEMDARLMDEVLAEHTSGIKLLLASRPERAELVTAPQFSRILNFLRQYYDYVIVDASHRLSDVTLAGLDASDLVLLVTSQDIPSIARTRKFLDLLPAMELDSARVLVVMNQYDPKSGIDPEKVSQAFRTKIAAMIPYAIEIVTPSINRGVPFMLQKEMAMRPIGRAILTMIEAVRQRLVELDKATTEEQKG